jgi:hypothetical protein
MEKIEIVYFTKPCGCSKITTVIDKALKAANLDATVIVKSTEDGNKFGIPEVPAMLINKKLAFSGYDPSKKEIKKYLLSI